jgi:Fur family transcriptional regulator, peroxide stress response regulator
VDPKSKELQQRMVELKEGLKRVGVKMTHQRLEIFREVARSGQHPDAETIYKGVRKRVPAVSLDTVYRTLWLLLDLGLITTLGPPRERVRFDANMSPHHHFICKKCGVAHDFYSEDLDHLQIPDAVKALGIVEKAQVDVRGLCLRCSKKANLRDCASRKEEDNWKRS